MSEGRNAELTLESGLKNDGELIGLVLYVRLAEVVPVYYSALLDQ